MMNSDSFYQIRVACDRAMWTTITLFQSAPGTLGTQARPPCELLLRKLGQLGSVRDSRID